MSVLDQVRQMRKEGISEQEISTRLQEQGITPKSIIDAFNQSKIKDAVEGEMPMQETFEPGVPPPQPTTPEIYTPATQEMPSPIPMTSAEPSYPPQEPTPQGTEEYYPQEGYDTGYGAGGVGTDTIIEVAEQVFEEKTKKIEKQLDDLKEFSTLAGTKISSFEDRIKRIETTIDNLQIKILEKIGSYGQGLKTIEKEMGMMQDSFRKMIPEIAKRQRAEPLAYKKEVKKPIIKKKTIIKKIPKK